jgi:molecular chaperone DnaK (HSP70)
MSGWLVAVDFGTTSTAVAMRASGGGAAQAVVFADGSLTMSSSVFAESDGRLIVGAEANNEAELAMDAFEPTPKRRISDGQIRLGTTSFDVAELIGAVIAPAIAETIQQNNNTSPSRVVMTHPVSWRAQRRAVLADALKAASARLGVALPAPVFVAEPIAAAQWYSRTDPARPGAYYAVYDLGGGTFDTTVLQATDEGFEVIASGGIDPLGGFDFDAALLNYLGTEYIAPADPELWTGLSLHGQPDIELARQRRRLQQSVGLLKLGLSTSPDKRIQLPGIASPVVVTRGEYESLIAGRIERTVGELEDTIADAGLSPEKLTAIYRIGGAARTPLVGAALDRFRVPVKVLDQPKLVVAQGAASRVEKAGIEHAPSDTPPPAAPESTIGDVSQPTAAVTKRHRSPSTKKAAQAASPKTTQALSPEQGIEFEVGDRVRIIDATDAYHLKVGTVTEISAEGDIRVKLGFWSGTYSYGTEELQFLNRPIRW